MVVTARILPHAGHDIRHGRGKVVVDNAYRAVVFYRQSGFVRSGHEPAVCRCVAPRMYETRTMRRLLRKVVPGTRAIREHASLRSIFGRLLISADLWHLNRASVAWAVSIGLFTAWVPVPFQMVLAAGAAILVRCNLPIAVASVWVSNAVTVAPMFYAAHQLGEWLLGIPPGEFRIELSLRWLLEELGQVWQPFLFGCFVLGLASAILGQFAIRLLWRAHVMVSWRERRLRRRRNGLDLSRSRTDRRGEGHP